jgi:translation initiation factor IF-2
VQQQNLRKQLDSLKAAAKIELAGAPAATPASTAAPAAPAPGAPAASTPAASAPAAPAKK